MMVKDNFAINNLFLFLRDIYYIPSSVVLTFDFREHGGNFCFSIKYGPYN